MNFMFYINYTGEKTVWKPYIFLFILKKYIPKKTV